MAAVFAIQLLASPVKRTADPPRVAVIAKQAVPPPALAPAPAPPARPPLIASTHGPCTELDFDGDGVADRYDAVPDSCGTGGCAYDLYLVRPGGDQFVGQIHGRCTLELEPRRRGLADVIAPWRLGTEYAFTRYRHDGRRYREISSEHCGRDGCTVRAARARP